MKYVIFNISHETYVGSLDSNTLLDATTYFVDKLIEDGEVNPHLENYTINPLTEESAEIEVVNSICVINYLIALEKEI